LTWNVPDEARPAEQNNQRNVWELESARATSIEDGDSIDLGQAKLEIIHTPGHTKGSVCIRYGNILFSGDHVLPEISPNIGGGDLKHSGLLNEFLRSLRRCQDIAPDIQQVMPGHGDPFSNLHERCQVLYDHHEKRLDEVSDILNDQGPQSVYSIATQMFGEIRDMHVVLGCAEAQAHLEFLVDAGRVAVDCDTYAAV